VFLLQQLTAGEVLLADGEGCFAAGGVRLAAGEVRLAARELDTRVATTWCLETRDIDDLFFFFSPGP
jgi:hypothetical protein